MRRVLYDLLFSFRSHRTSITDILLRKTVCGNLICRVRSAIFALGACLYLVPAFYLFVGRPLYLRGSTWTFVTGLELYGKHALVRTLTFVYRCEESLRIQGIYETFCARPARACGGWNDASVAKPVLGVVLTIRTCPERHRTVY
jgi:hypothetical protein